MPSRDAPTPGPRPSAEIRRHESTPVLADAFDRAWRHAGGDDLAREALQGILALFFDLDAWAPWLDEARALLDADELGRVGRKRRARDGDELALGYGLHRLVLGRVLGRDARDVALGRDRLGRPCVRDDESRTSLSHAGGAVAVAVCGPGVVGIDLEGAVRAAQMEEIAERVLHPAERAAVAGLPEPARARALLALWVRKEALLKAAGIGLAREMDSFRAPDGEPVALPAIDGSDGPAAVVRMVDAGPGWMAAVAGLPGLRAVARWLPPPRD